jgi:hypothetical protein
LYLSPYLQVALQKYIFSQYIDTDIFSAIIRSVKHKHRNKNWTHGVKNINLN